MFHGRYPKLDQDIQGQRGGRSLQQRIFFRGGQSLRSRPPSFFTHLQLLPASTNHVECGERGTWRQCSSPCLLKMLPLRRSHVKPDLSSSPPPKVSSCHTTGKLWFHHRCCKTLPRKKCEHGSYCIELFDLVHSFFVQNRDLDVGDTEYPSDSQDANGNNLLIIACLIIACQTNNQRLVKLAN